VVGEGNKKGPVPVLVEGLRREKKKRKGQHNTTQKAPEKEKESALIRLGVIGPKKKKSNPYCREKLRGKRKQQEEAEEREVWKVERGGRGGIRLSGGVSGEWEREGRWGKEGGGGEGWRKRSKGVGGGGRRREVWRGSRLKGNKRGKGAGRGR